MEKIDESILRVRCKYTKITNFHNVYFAIQYVVLLVNILITTRYSTVGMSCKNTMSRTVRQADHLSLRSIDRRRYESKMLLFVGVASNSYGRTRS